MSKMDELTARAIAAHETLEIKNLKRVVASQFESWTTVLFPLLQDQRIPCYRFVVGLLREDGHKVASENLVRAYIADIRKTRGIKAKPVWPSAQGQGVTPTVTPTGRMPVARVQHKASVVAPETVPLPVVQPVEVVDWHAQSRRLSEEGVIAVWRGEDEWMWNFLLNLAKPRGLDLFSNAPDVEDMLTITQKLCFAHLQNKFSRLRT